MDAGNLTRRMLGVSRAAVSEMMCPTTEGAGADWVWRNGEEASGPEAGGVVPCVLIDGHPSKKYEV